MNEIIKTSAGVISEFDAISHELIAASADPSFGEDQLEPLYIKLLDFFKSNSSHKKEIIEEILNVMRRYRTMRETKGRLLPGSAIAYVMHELRWPEIYLFADAENKNFYSEKMDTTMSNLMDAYSDEWEDRIFYSRFH